MSILVDHEILYADLAAQIDTFDRALEKRDLISLDMLLTEDFLQVAPNGNLRDRDAWSVWFAEVATYDQMRRKIIGSRSFADSTIVLSECFPIMRVRGGEPSVHTAVMLEVWTDREGRWQKAMEQFTRPPQNAA